METARRMCTQNCDVKRLKSRYFFHTDLKGFIIIVKSKVEFRDSVLMFRMCNKVTGNIISHKPEFIEVLESKISKPNLICIN